jgi:hypothetical protein
MPLVQVFSKQLVRPKDILLLCYGDQETSKAIKIFSVLGVISPGPLVQK